MEPVAHQMQRSHGPLSHYGGISSALLALIVTSGRASQRSGFHCLRFGSLRLIASNPNPYEVSGIAGVRGAVGLQPRPRLRASDLVGLSVVQELKCVAATLPIAESTDISGQKQQLVGEWKLKEKACAARGQRDGREGVVAAGNGEDDEEEVTDMEIGEEG
ncbi:hypothetical protein AXG93_4831s1170 [Marchantia polymorpha subsp. ruderalis]|uniref:Uncharacterized protein n=1 Tax=Marchantia polymorpha subsp. ruderalis TaxID=1480154 RepID=A0A176W8G0_MARPO|nr:hypothetical protein AXG93_4831s1170 [Marchantia polymorpha subsp. ruderalis]